MAIKKSVTRQEFGGALMEIIRRETADFYDAVAPKLKDAGFLKTREAEDRFAEELILLHLSIVWYTLNRDRGILDQLHHAFVEFDSCNMDGKLSGRIDQRVREYIEAIQRDSQSAANPSGPTPLAFATAAIARLTGSSMGVGLMLMMEISTRLGVVFPGVRKFRDQFDVN